MKEYRCLYNLDMGAIPLCLSRSRGAFEGVFSVEHVREFVRDAAGTGVDAFLCCPTLLRLPLWDSKEEPHWREEAPRRHPPELDAVGADILPDAGVHPVGRRPGEGGV